MAKEGNAEDGDHNAPSDSITPMDPGVPSTEVPQHSDAASGSLGTPKAGVDSFLKRELETQMQEAHRLGQELNGKLEELHALQDRFEGSMKKGRKLFKTFCAEGGSSDSGGLREPDVQLFRDSQSAIRQLSKFEPTSGGLFVRMFLGTVNMRFQRKKERLLFKEQYEGFKSRCSPVFMLSCIICLAFPDSRWIHMCLQLLLAFYYVTLALRENILQKNGSHIKQWWIVHHYVLILTAIILLTWPESKSYARFRNTIHVYGLYNSVVQIFSTRYQKARLYAMKALGKANEMDVANADTSQVHWSESMMVLIPLVLFGQGFQFYVSMALLRIFLDSRLEVHILIVAMCFLVMFVGNLSATVYTLKEKAGKKKRA